MFDKELGFLRLFKFNPYHDAKGRFTTANAGVKTLDGLGLARKDMPQIAQADMPEFFAFARLSGVRVTPGEAAVKSLRPTQSEYHAENARQLPEAALRKPLTVSKDHYVLDGHNRWARMVEDGIERVAVNQIDLPVQEALKLMHSFPKAFRKDVSQIGATIRKGLAYLFRFDPSQPRAPAGSATGGQWTRTGGGISYGGKDKGWVDRDGKPVSEALGRRLQALKLPPAWTNVALNPDEDGELQAIGYDTKGRKQYRYSTEHSQAASAEKFGRLAEFSKILPSLRRKIAEKLGDGKSETLDDSYAALRLIEKTGLRPGSDTDTKANTKAYGVTTLLSDHISVVGNKITVKFPGKKGVENTRAFTDPILATYLKGKKLMRGARVFDTTDARVRAAMTALGAEGFTPKDFRTWHGTAKAILALSKLPAPKTQKEAQKVKMTVAKAVSKYLGNTPKVALDAYINPLVFERHFSGTLTKKAFMDELARMEAALNDFVATTSFERDIDWQSMPLLGEDDEEAQLVAEGYEHVFRFDPNQPRANDGKWTAAGAGINSPAFKAWFGASAIVNPDGSPKVMYHGTFADFDEFIPDGSKEHKYIFTTSNPNAAAHLSKYQKDRLGSEGFSLDSLKAWWKKEGATDEQIEKLIEKTKKVRDSAVSVMPLYVRAENPFDYKNPEHVAALAEHLKDEKGLPETKDDDGQPMSSYGNWGLKDDIKQGLWALIEHPKAQEYIKQHHDSFWVEDDGPAGAGRSLAVYHPNQLKSSTGNDGNYSRSNNKVTKGLAAVFKYSPTQPRDKDGQWTATGAGTGGAGFKQWFGKSTIVNPDGSPKVMYHGTRSDIEGFVPKQAGAIYLTPSKRFAGYFAEGKHQASGNRELDEFGEEDTAAGANVMPVYVRAENPFDPSNPAHLKGLIESLPMGNDDGWPVRVLSSFDFNGELSKDMFAEENATELFNSPNNWRFIESPEAQAYIRKHHDGFWTNEEVEKGITTKNLAVYDPNQIKSALSNDGNYSRRDNRVHKGFAPVFKFDPNQPRAEDGKWTSTGAGTGINSPGFKEWFADSKIVDENGKPLIVYHGTKKDFDEFTAKYEDGLFFFSTNPKFAGQWPVGTGGKGDLREPPEGTEAEYDRLKQTERELYNQYMKDPDSYDFKTDEGTAAFDADRAALKDAMRRATGFSSAIEFEQNAGVKVMPLYLSIQKPFDPRKDYGEIEATLNAMGNGMDKLVEKGYHKSGNWLVYENKTVINKLKELGYDGIWLAENIDGPHETIAAFNSSQIKSATGNSGAFSRTDRRITKSFADIFKYDPNQARDLRGRWTEGSMGGLQMVSPNVQEGLGIDQAMRAMGEPRAKEVLEASQQVDGIVGLNIRHFPAVGAWKNGAENSLLCRVEPPATYDEIKVSAAMKGMLADQMAVIPFRVEEGGPASMYSMTVKSSDLKKLNQELVEMGIEYHTLEPSGESTNVWVFDEKSELRDKIREAAGKYDAQPKVWRGRGEILGSFESRTEGRKDYEETIARTLGPDKRGRWEGFYSGWRTTHEVLKAALKGLAHLFKYSPDQPRDQDGQWTKGGADYSNFKTMPSEIEGVPITKKLMSSKRTIARGDILGITLNTSKIARGYWNNLAERQQAHFDSGWFSSPHPNHVIWHELGHVKHHNNGNYSASESYLTNTNGTDAVFARVAKKVSRYAETNAKEFVAEVFAARRAGKIFDADVLRLYKHFGGPE